MAIIPQALGYKGKSEGQVGSADLTSREKRATLREDTDYP